MALQRGDKLTSLEGVNFEGSKEAIVVEVKEDPVEANKQLVTLYFPDLQTARRYKLPNNVVGVIDTTTIVGPSQESTRDQKDDWSNPVDEAVLHSKGWEKGPIRQNLPDSYFPPDPNYWSTLTDVLWRPDIRRTPWPRFYNYHRRRYSMAEEGIIVIPGTKENKADLPTFFESLKEYLSEELAGKDIDSFQVLPPKSLGKDFEITVSIDPLDDQVLMAAEEIASESGLEGAQAFRAAEVRRATTMRRRRIASPKLGDYWYRKFGGPMEIYLSGDERQNRELEELSLSSPVGKGCKDLIDKVDAVLSVADENGYGEWGSSTALEMLIDTNLKMAAEMCELWYHG